MFIVQTGAAFRKIVPDLTGKQFADYFDLRRPRLKPRFDDIREAKDAAFLISVSDKQLSLRGQMLLDEQRKLLVFVGSPVVESVELLRRYQFSLSDFPMSDSSVDILMFQQQKLINKRLEGLIFERTKDLELERNKTEKLLHAILPAHIVRHLRDHREIIAEHFEQVTVMFLDLVGFTALTLKMVGPSYCESAE